MSDVNLMADERSVLGQPFLKVRELDGARFLQRTGGKTPYPIVVDAESGGDGAMLPYPLFYRLPSLLNALFYRHAS